MSVLVSLPFGEDRGKIHCLVKPVGGRNRDLLFHQWLNKENMFREICIKH